MTTKATVASLGTSPETVLRDYSAHERGLGVGDVREIEMVGESLTSGE